MQRAFIIAALGLWMGLSGPAMAAAADKTPEQLEQQYDREKSAKKRAELARSLMNSRLQQLRSALDSGALLQDSSPEPHNYLAAVDRLGKAVSEAHHSGTSKQSEVHLRSHLRELNNMKMDASMAEQGILEQAIEQVSALREQILYSIMMPAEESAKQ